MWIVNTPNLSCSGITQELIYVSIPQQNRDAKKKNHPLLEVAQVLPFYMSETY